MSTVGATIVVEFGTGADSSAFVAVELDDRLNVDAEGEVKTQFNPGDQVWFWVQHDPSLRIDRVRATSGMVVSAGSASRTRDQQCTWTGEASVELSHIPAGSPTLTWYGNVGTGLSRDGRKLRVAGNTPCTADAVVPINVHLYRYVPPPMALGEGETWRSVIVVYLEAAA